MRQTGTFGSTRRPSTLSSKALCAAAVLLFVTAAVQAQEVVVPVDTDVVEEEEVQISEESALKVGDRAFARQAMRVAQQFSRRAGQTRDEDDRRSLLAMAAFWRDESRRKR